MNALKDRVKQVRQMLGLNQTQLAERIGAQKTLVSLWESGRVEIPTARVYQLADVLQCRRVWLETGDGEIFEPETTPQDRETQRRVLSEMFARLTQEQQALVRAAVGLLDQAQTTTQLSSNPCQLSNKI